MSILSLLAAVTISVTVPQNSTDSADWTYASNTANVVDAKGNINFLSAGITSGSIQLFFTIANGSDSTAHFAAGFDHISGMNPNVDAFGNTACVNKEAATAAAPNGNFGTQTRDSDNKIHINYGNYTKLKNGAGADVSTPCNFYELDIEVNGVSYSSDPAIGNGDGSQKFCDHDADDPKLCFPRLRRANPSKPPP